MKEHEFCLGNEVCCWSVFEKVDLLIFLMDLCLFLCRVTGALMDYLVFQGTQDIECVENTKLLNQITQFVYYSLESGS